MNRAVRESLALLDLHYESFYAVQPYAAKTGHPVPMDTRGWSQILVSTLCGVKGLERKKGADLTDGSDVKGANTWEAIDTPRFNGVIKAGTKAETAGKILSLESLPHLYFVLWDKTPRSTARCRVWAVRPRQDREFRAMCERWYELRNRGKITSNNFQLHPPRGLDSNVLRNTSGNLQYPLYFAAERAEGKTFEIVAFRAQVRETGLCQLSE
jgi:MamI restriction endonuclease